MPSGKTHDRLTGLCLPFIFWGGWQCTQDWTASLIVTASFGFAGFMFSGDLDTKSVQYKRWGWLRWIWLPYRKMVKHRSAFSHDLLLGLVTRLTYLSVWFIGVFGLIGWASQLLKHPDWTLQSRTLLQQVLGYFGEKPLYAGLMLVGLWLGGFSHTLPDYLLSSWKWMRRKLRGSPRKPQRPARS